MKQNQKNFSELKEMTAEQQRPTECLEKGMKRDTYFNTLLKF